MLRIPLRFRFMDAQAAPSIETNLQKPYSQRR
jgi:hypothetical protein